MPRLFVIGVQPPPLHGLSAINRAMLELLRERNPETISIDLSAGDASRARFAGLRALRVTTGLLKYTCAAFTARRSATYLALSGGSGQVFDLFFLAAARLSGSRIVLHHHSFVYLDRRSRLTAALVWIAGRQATHIVLGEVMRCALQERYKSAIHAEVVSNAAIVPLNIAENAIRKELKTVGFLSNITKAKGIDDLFAVAEKVGVLRPQLRFVVAGPIAERGLKESFEQRLALAKNVEYVGPVYGAAKIRFLSEIDVLLFPTRYKNEAEPLTIHEALGSATPVIANARGCIASIVPNDAGRVVNDPDAFVQVASDQICNWVDAPSDFQKASECARHSFCTLRASQKTALEQLLVQLSDR